MKHNCSTTLSPPSHPLARSSLSSIGASCAPGLFPLPLVTRSATQVPRSSGATRCVQRPRTRFVRAEPPDELPSVDPLFCSTVSNTRSYSPACMQGLSLAFDAAGDPSSRLPLPRFERQASTSTGLSAALADRSRTVGPAFHSPASTFRFRGAAAGSPLLA